MVPVSREILISRSVSITIDLLGPTYSELPIINPDSPFTTHGFSREFD